MGLGDEVTIDKDKKTIKVVNRIKYSKNDLKKLEEGGSSLEKLKQDHDYYYKPGKDGKTQAVADFEKATGLKASDYGALSGNADGTFNFEVGGTTYKLSFEVEFSESFDGSSDLVDNIEWVEGKENNSYEGDRRMYGFNSGTIASKGAFSHERGHDLGIPDLWMDEFKDLAPPIVSKIKYTNQFNIKMSNGSVGDLMQLPQFRFITVSGMNQSFIKDAITLANTVSENKVSMSMGGVYYTDVNRDNKVEKARATDRIISKN